MQQYGLPKEFEKCRRYLCLRGWRACVSGVLACACVGDVLAWVEYQRGWHEGVLQSWAKYVEQNREIQ